MNNKNIILAIIFIIVLQSSLLFAMIARQQAILSSQTVVVLETKPIDPRSLFRGDYVRLNYTINTLQLSQLSGDKTFKRHDSVYVVLQKKQTYWQAQAVFQNMPAILSEDEAIIQGVVKSVNNQQWNVAEKKFVKVRKLQVSYGIENYFVAEGEGLKLERPKEGGVVTLKIALDEQGDSAIKALLLNGEAQYEEELF